MNDNDIIPSYQEHLGKVNMCIKMFEKLETNRTYGVMFNDWADGTRSKVINNELIPRLRELKEEILEGISCFTKLLVQKDHIEKAFEELNSQISTFKLDFNDGMAT